MIPSYKNEPFITGSGTNHNVKTEIFDLRRMEWLAGADYPFTKMNIQKKYLLDEIIVTLIFLGFMAMQQPGQLMQFSFLVDSIPKVKQ